MDNNNIYIENNSNGLNDFVDSLKLVSINHRGGFSNDLKRESFKQLVNDHDIIFIQEHWLSKQQLDILLNVHVDFTGIGQSPMCDSVMNIGRPYGGVGILWRKSLDRVITPVIDNKDWVLGIKIETESKSAVFMSVYMPYNCDNNTDDYLEKLSILRAIIDDLNTSSIYLVGDFNANFENSSAFGNLLSDFCSENKYNISDKHFLPSDSYTYFSEAWHTTSWLDHCITTQDAHDSIVGMNILYDYIISDHHPLCMTIDMNVLPSLDHEAARDSLGPSLNFTENNIIKYQNNLRGRLNVIVHCMKLPQCSDPNCKDLEHIGKIELFYNEIVEAMKHSGEECASKEKNTHKHIPGWNDFVNEVHNKARENYLLWRNEGRPRSGEVYKSMNDSRREFKSVLKQCRKRKEEIISNNLAGNLLQRDHKKFWKNCKKATKSKAPLPSSIDQVNGATNIAKMWKQHYEHLFNSVPSNVSTMLHDISVQYDTNMLVDSKEVTEAISSLKLEKAPGKDSLTPEHLKYACFELHGILANIFSACFMHGFLPQAMMETFLVPVIKDKCKRLSDKGNYRPIALATQLSKVFEICLLKRLDMYLFTAYNQFGFKAGHGTDSCIYAIKELLRYYRSCGNSMFLGFLDASKAFDRVNHATLFGKLKSRGVPVYILRILIFWYVNQCMYVRWGSVLSDPFSVTNGVRQGSLLSPRLYCVYMDDLSSILNNLQIGCYVNKIIVNHLMYADDVILFSPSRKGLQTLLQVTYEYGEENDISFNATKSHLLVCRSKEDKHIAYPSLYIGENGIKEVEKVKYLGHWICNDLSDDLDIERQIQNLYMRAHMLKRTFSHCSYAVKRCLFLTYCTCLYTSPLWVSYRSSTMNKIRVAYNNCLRMIFVLPKVCSISMKFVELDITMFHALLRKQIYSFKGRLDTIDNGMVRAILDSDVYFKSTIWLYWRQSLHL